MNVLITHNNHCILIAVLVNVKVVRHMATCSCSWLGKWLGSSSWTTRSRDSWLFDAIQAFCVNLPAWSTKDQVICLSEMKLGFMAAGCMAPGFSTLLANLFVMRSYKKVCSWRYSYNDIVVSWKLIDKSVNVIWIRCDINSGQSK